MYDMVKNKPVRSQKYTDFVKSLPSCVSGKPAEVGHHIIACGCGGKMGGKESDIWQIPLTHEEHDELHADVEAWKRKHGSQLMHAKKVVDLAFSLGVLTVKGSRK